MEGGGWERSVDKEEERGISIYSGIDSGRISMEKRMEVHEKLSELGDDHDNDERTKINITREGERERDRVDPP